MPKPRTTRRLRLWMCGMFISATYILSADSPTPPPMRPGNGSELEIKGGELSWPRTEQLPTSTPNDRFIQKRLDDHLESASLQIMKPSTLFPENPSEFILNVILLHAVKDSIASQYDEKIARMVDMFLVRNLLQPISDDRPAPVNGFTMGMPNTMSTSVGIAYVGVIDPVELYREWQRKKRALRTKMVLMTLFGDTTRLLTKHETDSIKQSLDKKRNAPVSRIANPVLISTLLANDTIVAPSKPKFTAPLWGKERPKFNLEPTFSPADSIPARPGTAPLFPDSTILLPDSVSSRARK